MWELYLIYFLKIKKKMQKVKADYINLYLDSFSIVFVFECKHELAETLEDFANKTKKEKVSQKKNEGGGGNLFLSRLLFFCLRAK